MTYGTGANWQQRLSGIAVEEVVCVILFVFFLMSGSIPGIAPNQSSEMTHVPATRLMMLVGIGSQLLINSVIVLLLVRHGRELVRCIGAMQWTAAIIVLALLSTVWSQAPWLTIRRAIPFGLAALFGLYFAARFPVRKQLSILWVTMILVSLGTIALATAFPKIGWDASPGHTGDWQGVFTQKNACGRVMVLATALTLCMKGSNVRKWMSLVLFTFVLIMSGSRGAWVIDTALIGAWALQRIIRRLDKKGRAVALCGMAAVLSACAYLGMGYFPEIMQMLGRNATLTGRTAIWGQVWLAIVKHPLLGYGFSAFWQGLRGQSFHIILALHFVVLHAHNGFLEIWLELGGIGLLLFILSYLRAWRKIWPAISSERGWDAAWMFCVLVFSLLYNIDENTVLIFNGVFWILYVACVVNIELPLIQGKNLSSGGHELFLHELDITAMNETRLLKLRFF